ncbi:hypothetical protein FACS1894211_16250 [Clostridia bacterium]|nr:hypothetical protein FACS1894211_16250 [Clostridia bacterium]
MDAVKTPGSEKPVKKPENGGESVRPNAFKRFARICLRESWGLKIFALLFAAFVWLMLTVM